MVGREAEAGGIAKHGAKLVTAVACARVPKITLIIGSSSYFKSKHCLVQAAVMVLAITECVVVPIPQDFCSCGRMQELVSSQLNMIYKHFDNLGVMGGEQAANVLATVQRDQRKREGREWTDEEECQLKQPVEERFEREGK